MQHFNSKKHQNKRIQEPFILYTQKSTTERQNKESSNYETSGMSISFKTTKSSSDLNCKQPIVQRESFNRRFKNREKMHLQCQSRIEENKIQQTKLQIKKFQLDNGLETFLDSFNKDKI